MLGIIIISRVCVETGSELDWDRDGSGSGPLGYHLVLRYPDKLQPRFSPRIVSYQSVEHQKTVNQTAMYSSGRIKWRRIGNNPAYRKQESSAVLPN
jgi:hypothetical protein